MYRQIWIDSQDRKFLKILWREDPQQVIKEYQLRTVTYGTACAPFQAIRCLHQLAIEGASQWPNAAKILRSDFYVDDLITGCETIIEGANMVNDLRQLLESAGFDLRKWACNKLEVLEGLDKELKEVKEPFFIGAKQEIKTLGIKWDPETDKLSFIIPNYKIRSYITKRTILSDLACIFDPLGWLSPITINGKILFQQLWKTEMKWDDKITGKFVDTWEKYKMEIESARTISLSRHIVIPKGVKYELIIFSDASQQAYAAVAYLRTSTVEGEELMHLIAARTKVAPLKSQSLPRLELCAALLGSTLAKAVQIAMSHLTVSITAYTDSMIVLGWLKSPASKWKTFVSHRVNKIHMNLPNVFWKHISSKCNPADCATRAQTVIGLEKNLLWWNGPKLEINTQENVNISDVDTKLIQKEMRIQNSVLLTIEIENTFIKRFSSLFRLVRITTWILRFVHNIRMKEEGSYGQLSIAEHQQAMRKLIMIVQHECFSQEIKQLLQRKPLSSTSKILSLNPFVDDQGVLRVGGRIRKSIISENSKFPMLLPNSHHFTRLLIKQTHLNLLHGGPQLIMNIMRQKFWIINSRSTIRKVIHTCIPCQRHKGITATQLMGDLPEARVRPSQPFAHCGVDFAGPFLLYTMASGRAKRKLKGYVAIFICLATKAVHLELVSNLTTSAFIAALRRFSGRRGRPHAMYSDCGTNFKGADQELKKLCKTINCQNSNSELKSFLIKEEITWFFNPPAAPHYGGLWEAAVKSMKYHLKRVVGNTVLNYEEMDTVLIQIEACLNSRPLSPLSEDPSDCEVLTPSHFLIGVPLSSIPDPDLTQQKVSLLTRWQHCQQMIQHFWKRWSKEYLLQLQQRTKWKSKQPNVNVGDIVLIKEDNLPPQQWRMGRVLNTDKSSDGLVRSVTIQTNIGVYKRPIVKIIPLQLEKN